MTDSNNMFSRKM